MKRILFLLCLILALLMWAFMSVSWGNPWLVSDPSPTSIGGEFEVWETTSTRYSTYQNLFMVDWNEPDGSISMDLINVPVGVHQWQVRYNVDSEMSAFVPCVLSVTQVCARIGKKPRPCTKYYNLTP